MAYMHIPNREKEPNYLEMTEHEARIARRLHDPTYKYFTLDSKFVEGHSDSEVPFGFNGLGETTYMRSYSRIKNDGKNEQWHETVARVIEGTYNLQKRRIESLGVEWKEHQAQKSAQEMYQRMFEMKLLPPGRGLWAMGSPITEEKGLYAALNNCAFVSTDNLCEDLEKPFTFLMDASMLGVGVGFDTKGAGQVIIKSPDRARNKEIYDIPDTREGWVKSLGIVLRSYFLGDPEVELRYDNIREMGKPISTFGGVASGPGPLKDMHVRIKNILEEKVGNPVSERDIVDIQNLIGKCVVSGNVRRSSEIAFGDPSSEEFLNLKNYNVNPERKEFGWSSNNSIFAEVGMNYEDVAERIRENGEPGIAWLDNMRGYSRMDGVRDDKDIKVKGGNPCLEQSLESYELCCLVETFPHKHENLDDFLRTLKFSYLYAKSVTLGETHWPETNKVMSRNRRIGNSVSGIAQFISHRGVDELGNWLNKGYDEIQDWDKVYSDWLSVPRSIKTTSVKPSGSVSLVAGATPGIHYPHSEFYIRRIRIAKNSNLIAPLTEAGYPMEDDKFDPSSTVVEFPVAEEGVRKKEDVSMWEQLHIASFMQKNWADNQVSATVSFDPKTEGKQIAPALDYFQYSLKGISFLPNSEHGYEQAPYEEITKDQYRERFEKLKPIDFSNVSGEKADVEKFCDGDTCLLEVGKPPEVILENESQD